MEETIEKPKRNIKRQQYLVEKLQHSYDEKPSDETKLKLDREIDTLKQFMNAEKGDVKNRAKEKAEFARKTLLNKAIHHIPQE